MIIKNYKDHKNSPVKKDLLDVVEIAIQEVVSKGIFARSVSCRENTLTVNNKEYDISDRRIFIIGGGKAAYTMAEEIEDILGPERIEDGLVVVNEEKKDLKKIKVHKGDHPIPTEKSMKGVDATLALKEKHQIDQNDLIIALVSGGGSALLCKPEESIPLEDKKKMFDLFIKAGIPGYESTIIKTKLSKTKGGALAQHFYPTPIISLIISDDNGESGDEMTASGPFTEHSSTFEDALGVIDKYNLREKTPISILSFLENNHGEVKNSCAHVDQHVLSSNAIMLDGLKKKLNEKEKIVVAQGNLKNEASEEAYRICKEVFEGSNSKPRLYLYGGETIVNLPEDHGKGGRCQEFIAASLDYLEKHTPQTDFGIVCIGTDGVDFIKESAGGIIDNISLELLQEKNLKPADYLKKHNTYELLSLLGAHVVMRGTGTNVGDLVIIYKGGLEG
ncbi:hypothetical protein CL654_02885 [bacterium]|nr:hypothetical protein [bacterium]|tara:strand:- start:26856 stop:28196 length:1341 start_codon:yes stop_codon:yes gene_type:complete